MKTYMKKWLAIAIAVAMLAFVLAGCSQATSSSAASASASSASASSGATKTMVKDMKGDDAVEAGADGLDAFDLGACECELAGELLDIAGDLDKLLEPFI